MSQRLAVSVTGSVNGLAVGASSFVATASGLVQVQEVVPAAIPDGEEGGPADGVLEVNWPVDVSAAKGLFLLATGGDLALETDQAESLTLVNGVPLAWSTDTTFDAPFASDVASLTLTNTSFSDVTLVAVAVVDATPEA